MSLSFRHDELKQCAIVWVISGLAPTLGHARNIGPTSQILVVCVSLLFLLKWHLHAFTHITVILYILLLLHIEICVCVNTRIT